MGQKVEFKPELSWRFFKVLGYGTSHIHGEKRARTNEKRHQ